MRKATEVYEACNDQLGPLIKNLRALNSRLNVGLTYDEYTDEVADLRVEYDQVEFDELGDAGLDCLSGVGVPAEKAMNQYAKAAGTWGDCIEDFGCDTDSIQPGLQRRWARAGIHLELAKNGLEELEEKTEPRKPKVN